MLEKEKKCFREEDQENQKRENLKCIRTEAQTPEPSLKHCAIQSQSSNSPLNGKRLGW